MNLWQNYFRPKTLTEAMDAFRNAPGPLVPIAGGTDLLLDLEQGRHFPVQTLIDVTSIEELTLLELRGDELFIGASVPVNRIVLDPLVGAHAQALVEACDLIAGPQVRNVATLGGNVAHALPAADGTIALLALDVQAEIASVSTAGRVAAEWRTLAPHAHLPWRAVPGSAGVETRLIPFQELFLGPGKSSIKHGEELIVGFYLPLSKKGQASSFKRIMRPQGVALPIINVAIWLERKEGVIKDIRIAVGPGGPTPWIATEAEKVLTGNPLNDETLNAALEALLAQVGFRSSARRASADYRRHIASGLFEDVLETAWKRTY